MGLSVAAMALSFIIIITLMIGASSLSWVIAGMVVRGSIIAYWMTGFILLCIGFFALGARDPDKRMNLTTAMLITAAFFVVLTIVAGVDLTRMLTSPTTFLGKLGDLVSHKLTNSRLTPHSVRGVEGKTLLGMVGKVGTSIVIMQLISVLPFPYNLLLFFVYYKFVTGMLFCGIPTALAIWAFTQIYSLRSQLKLKYSKNESRETSSSEESSDDDEIRRPLKKEKKDKLIVQYIERDQTSPVVHSQQHLMNTPDRTSSTIYPNV